MQETGSITQYIDVAQIVLYVFWFFFAGLIWYLHREDKREGYPLESDRSAHITVQGFPAMPEERKVFHLASGQSIAVNRVDARELALRPSNPWRGAPLEPTGDGMVDGVGPGSYSMRGHEPDLTIDGQPRIVPMRVATDFSVASEDMDPRGVPVLGADGVTGGYVTDLWVDRSEPIIRFYELEVPAAGGRHVLLPYGLARVNKTLRRIEVATIMGRHFAGVPALSNPDQVTLAEEDRIYGYYGGGSLYADPSRTEPLV
jgi:photosynthetic reaction center H subunit